MTTKRQAIQHIRGPAAKEAADTVRNVRPYNIGENTFHIAEGTHLHSKIVREHNRLALMGAAANMPITHPGVPGRTRFDATLRAARRMAQRSILVSLANLLDTHPGDPPHPVYNDPDVQAAALQEAENALPPYAPPNGQTAGEAGYQALRTFLGHHTVEATLQAFGPRAALKHAALYARNAQTIHRAAELFPNAAILLGARTYLPQREAPVFTTVQEAIDNAKTIFNRDVAYHPRPKGNDQDRNDDDKAEFLWTIFMALPHDVLRNADLHQLGAPLAYLCGTISEVQQLPRPKTLATLLDNPQLLRSAPKALIHAFILYGPTSDSQNSHAEDADQLLDLHALIRQGKALVKAGNSPNRTAALITDAEDSQQAPTWDALVHAAQQDQAPPGTRVRKRAKAPNYMELEQTFRSAAFDDPLLMITESPTWTQGPNNSLKLFGPDPAVPYLEIAQDSDLNIHLTTDQPLSQLPSIPSVHDQRPRAGPPARPIRTSGWNRLEHLINRTATHRLMEGAMRYVRENWHDLRSHPSLARPNPDQTMNAITSALSSLQVKDHYTVQHQKLAEEIDATMTGMAHQTVVAQARKHTEEVTTFHYNAVLNLGAKLTDLARSNPGAVAWAMNHANSHETVRHPGQIISIAKASLREAGLRPQHWKFVATLDRPIIRETPRNSTQMLAVLLNAMAAADTVLPADTADFTAQKVLAPAYRRTVANSRLSDEERALTLENITLMLTLLCRQHSTGEENTTTLMDQALDAMDYVTYISRQGATLRSTTFAGLLKATHHWHRDVRQAEILDEWEHTRASRRKLLSWESLIGPTRKGDLDITPLTTEFQLFQESREMSHCVINYAQNCAQGDRIFSISRGGVKLATSQITRTPQGYQEVQTRGRDNHAVTGEIRNAMQAIAREYEHAALIEERREAEDPRP